MNDKLINWANEPIEENAVLIALNEFRTAEQEEAAAIAAANKAKEEVDAARAAKLRAWVRDLNLSPRK
jgi:hypothetical protein